jgi:acetate kinase
MTRHILALNSGSSSVKFGVYSASSLGPKLILEGVLDKHSDQPQFSIKNAEGKSLIVDAAIGDGEDWSLSLLEQVESLLSDGRVQAVGHRVVHGGTAYSESVLINAAVLSDLEKLTPLAPLHQPDCLAPVIALMKARPGLAQVACFDTAFHRGLDAVYHRFPLPDLPPDIRRYGFHGLSFAYIAGKIEQPNARAVVAHLGSGSSVCAITNGRSINTSMSLTPLDGLMMGTRSGAVDPGLLLYLQKSKAMSVTQLEDTLYHRSGLLGVSGKSADMRVLEKDGSDVAVDAIRQFCERAAEQIAVMATSLRGIDLLIFTGGIGEHSAATRHAICTKLQWLGIDVAARSNETNASIISSGSSRVQVRVVPTDEQVVIAKETLRLSRA